MRSFFECHIIWPSSGSRRKKYRFCFLAETLSMGTPFSRIAGIGTSSTVASGLCGDRGSSIAFEETSGAAGAGAEVGIGVDTVAGIAGGADIGCCAVSGEGTFAVAAAAGSCIGVRERLGTSVGTAASPAAAASSTEDIRSGDPTNSRGERVGLLESSSEMGVVDGFFQRTSDADLR